MGRARLLRSLSILFALTAACRPVAGPGRVAARETDVPIAMRDGVVLGAEVLRPAAAQAPTAPVGQGGAEFTRDVLPNGLTVLVEERPGSGLVAVEVAVLETARGGILVAIADRYRLPVHFIGVGEGIADLAPFAARDFARAVVGLGD